eukprot:EC726820.1.p3 GENE.EC726820.1~~EC726820.1.p3  ORF type:complete len:72 (+),score=1.90 EC726820.1:153-368(+)
MMILEILFRNPILEIARGMRRMLAAIRTNLQKSLTHNPHSLVQVMTVSMSSIFCSAGCALQRNPSGTPTAS